MAFVGLADLSRFRDPLVFVRELLRVLAAHVVEPARDAAFEPFGERGVRPDFDLGAYPAFAEPCRGGSRVVGHPEIVEPSAQVGPVDPGRDVHVPFLRNEEGRREAVHEPFRRALPLPAVVADPEKLSGEGDLAFGQPEVLTHEGPNPDFRVGQIVLPGTEAPEFLPDAPKVLLEFPERLPDGIPALFRGVLSGCHFGGEFRDLSLRFEEDGLRQHLVAHVEAEPGLVQPVDVRRGPPSHMPEKDLLPVDLLLYFGDPASAAAFDIHLQRLPLVFEGRLIRFPRRDALLNRRESLFELRLLFLEQALFGRREPVFERGEDVLLPCFERHDVRVRLVLAHHGVKNRYPPLRLQDLFVDFRQVVEVLQEFVDLLPGREGFEHVLPDERFEAVDGLHGYRLEEQVQRLVVLDADLVAEPRDIGFEGLENPDARGFHPLFQSGDVPEAAEILRDGEVPLEPEVDPDGLVGPVFHGAEKGRRQRLLRPRVPECAENHRIGVALPEVLRFERSGEFVLVRLVLAADIGEQAPFARAGAGRLVVRGLAGRREKRRDRVDDGRFSRPDIPGQQHVFAFGANDGDGSVECPPVVEFDPVEPEPAFLFPEHLIHRPPPCRLRISRRAPRVRRTRRVFRPGFSATEHRRNPSGCAGPRNCPPRTRRRIPCRNSAF